LLRGLRRWVTGWATDAGMWMAPQLSAAAVDRIGHWIGRCGGHLPLLVGAVADNMRAAGVYSPAAVRDYFVQVGIHLAGALHALRSAGARSAHDRGFELAELARARIELDASVGRLGEVAATGGVILVGPHIANYLLGLARLNQEIPLTVYLRHSKDPRRQEAKRRWCRAAGVEWICEPPDVGSALGRLGPMAAALRNNRALFITPDLPQKRGQGVPVDLFGRRICLPAGPAWLALRTRAPMYLLLAEVRDQGQRLIVHGPFEHLGASSGRAERRTEVQRRMQWFAAKLERFLREQTPLWYLWGDKRWTRLFHGDRRYVSLPRPDRSPARPAAVAYAHYPH